MPRLYVATSDDLAVLRATFQNTHNSPEHRASAWYRFETILWYNAFKEGRLTLQDLERKHSAAVREYIMERNVRNIDI